MAALNLEVVPGTFAVTKLAAGLPTPDWATSGLFTSVTRTSEELSIVGPEENVPVGVESDRGWTCMRIAGKIDLSIVRVLSSLVSPLALADIAVFAISTFDTDYLFVKAEKLARAVHVLMVAGHRVKTE